MVQRSEEKESLKESVTFLTVRMTFKMEKKVYFWSLSFLCRDLFPFATVVVRVL